MTDWWTGEEGESEADGGHSGDTGEMWRRHPLTTHDF